MRDRPNWRRRSIRRKLKKKQKEEEEEEEEESLKALRSESLVENELWCER